MGKPIPLRMKVSRILDFLSVLLNALLHILKDMGWRILQSGNLLGIASRKARLEETANDVTDDPTEFYNLGTPWGLHQKAKFQEAANDVTDDPSEFYNLGTSWGLHPERQG